VLRGVPEACPHCNRSRTPMERVWLAVLGATEGYAEHTNTIDKVRGALKQGCTDVGDVESMLVELETTGAIAITTTADGDEIVRVNG
jgi:hypothetical protein